MANNKPVVEVSLFYGKTGLVVIVEGGNKYFIPYGDRFVSRSWRLLMENTELLEKFDDQSG